MAALIFFAGCESLATAEPPQCPSATALLPATDPAYADAMDLKQSLESYGLVVRCVFPTKFGSIFQVADGGVVGSTIEGEASFRTDAGDIDAVFLPKPQTFADFKITERRDGPGYLYTFAGTPRVWDVNRFGTAHRIYFLKHDSQLLVTDEKLRDRLQQAWQPQPGTP